ncbi:MAG TPA: amidohydrolase family protein [Geminicoccus sp.]|jgi:predicted TIM-barrel fold metal-dependent hydrolase|uniref:amidohydrolase family protein n=1 Tax=Geminicoccus sp. TaxID=2024832 RepID=UPI002E3616B5|nr:amidohydrolase family protein [Geminicoccus sp.]HEX2528026.1 amidohydrolase family protein [Geminicoccus sp.]
MQVVDPHMHLWDLETHRYPWLQPPGDMFIGDYHAIAKTHLLEDFLADAGSIQVQKIVHIDAGHDPSDPLGETRWLQAIADDPTSNGMPNAIVAGADLSKPDVERLLAAHAEHRNMRGIRQILNVHPDKRLDFVGRQLMADDGWRKNFKLLAKYGLSFDLQIYPDQMAAAAGLAAGNPDIPIILNHTGMFADRNSVQGWRIWRDGMRLLAGQANVSVKLSGLGMLDHHWTVESLRPYVLEAVDAFGTERAMFASNFPVDRLFSSYEQLWQAFATIVADMSEAEKAALFRTNAERVYRI